MKKIIFATHNEGKMKEIKEILKDLGLEILSLKDLGLTNDIVEDGSTFEENAIIKAKAFMKLTGEIVLADDSGLEVDYMNKEPGIHSARFLGKDTSYKIKNQYIIEKLANAKGDDRKARFVAAIACAFPSGEVTTTYGVIEGYINEKAVGDNGFGYDPIFYIPEHGLTTAQMDSELKNVISHRAKALEDMKKVLGEKIQ